MSSVPKRWKGIAKWRVNANKTVWVLTLNGQRSGNVTKVKYTGARGIEYQGIAIYGNGQLSKVYASKTLAGAKSAVIRMRFNPEKYLAR